MKFSPETARGSRHKNCREISGEFLLFLFPQEAEARKCPEFFTTNVMPFFTRRFAAANTKSHGVFHSADIMSFVLDPYVPPLGPQLHVGQKSFCNGWQLLSSRTIPEQRAHDVASRQGRLFFAVCSGSRIQLAGFREIESIEVHVDTSLRGWGRGGQDTITPGNLTLCICDPLIQFGRVLRGCPHRDTEKLTESEEKKTFSGFLRKILVSVKFVSAILGPEMGAPVLWTPGKMRSFCRKNHVRKIPLFGGGFWGGECRFYFYGRADFSEFLQGVFRRCGVFTRVFFPLPFAGIPCGPLQ